RRVPNGRSLPRLLVLRRGPGPGRRPHRRPVEEGLHRAMNAPVKHKSQITNHKSLDDILEALELPRSEPGIGYLQALFARFNERVPFESASKIVRNAAVDRVEEKSRTP